MGVDVQAPAGTTAEAPENTLLDRSPRSAGRKPLDPQTMRDLALDQLITRLLEGRTAYDLGPCFAAPLASAEEVLFRQEVFRDLDGTALRATLSTFCAQMLAVRRTLAPTSTMHYRIQREYWVLDAASRYVAAIRAVVAGLADATPRSRGVRGMQDWLTTYAASTWFQDLVADSDDLLTRLDSMRYRLRIYGDTVEVSPVRDDEPDYTADVVETFARFRQGETKSYLHKVASSGGMDHVEAAIAGFVARLHPETFDALRRFTERHLELIDPQVASFEREAQFYLAYLEVMDELRPAGVPFCYPRIDSTGQLDVIDGIDIALALSLRRDGVVPVPNDCHLAAQEQVVVVTGPNQGGKTTFARMLGQHHLLAAWGLPVPAASARVPLVDNVATLFERGENLDDLRGHLYDDLVRARDAIETVGAVSLVVLNEVFSSTSLEDAVYLGAEIINRLRGRGARCVCVTFLDELTRLPGGTVSLVAGVDTTDPTRRTFQVLPRPADGLAYAKALADKHALSRKALTRRLHR